MADSIDVTLTLGYDHGIRDELHEYLTAPALVNEQSLTLLCGGEGASRDLYGSGQAGTLRVYGGLIRRGSSSEVTEYLEKAPWRGVEAVLVVHETHGPATIHRLGHSPTFY